MNASDKLSMCERRTDNSKGEKAATGKERGVCQRGSKLYTCVQSMMSVDMIIKPETSQT